ncbi:MAG: transcriptional repressor LexA [Rhodospirillales bacterium]|nr:transcriptional repressor LexA [Rhodospirillales bacterium]MCW8861860.1 transcriptional repressor LexA [Rhodospirillales bacterium]MCW8953207.1 transcriptional repressor LexA [Rhodospirillales bacterium]MCW9002533.1 transcriptional repressor LexA [Rhodospirillales bacterium]MCW9038893.1 transcriptional repressor LexA [Rhodospirillales bacterium]
MLTKKQRQLLIYIDEKLRENGVAPSFDEMKEALDLRSKSGIHRLISALEERGFIRRLPHRARALEVIRLPESSVPDQRATKPATGSSSSAAGTPPGFSSNVIRGGFSTGAVAPPPPPANETIDLPLYGKIAAGTPIEALRDPVETIGIPASMLGSGDHYALEVDGDSMIEAGILDSDIVVIQNCNTAENGSIVVALVDNEEVTLKRLRRKGASIALEPANVAYETRIFPSDRVKVQGKLVGLFRRY